MTHHRPGKQCSWQWHSTRSSRITIARFSPEVCPRTVSQTRATVVAGARSAARDSRWLLLVCFVSGAAGLIFEMVWFHRSGLVFGNSVWATSLVLSSFMGGLTIGSAIVGRSGHRVRRFLRAYAATEAAVAVSGVALTHALPGLTSSVVTLTRPAAENLWLINAVRFVTAFTILLVPSTAMGATLPLLVAALARWRAGFGSALGQAYGWNTLGAVAGVVGAEVWLIGRLGVAGSAWFAASLSLGAATLALWLSRRARVTQAVTSTARTSRESPGSRSEGPLHHVSSWPLLACSFLSGGTLLALEVVWFRFLTMYVLSTTLAASLMLAVVLAAIGLGGLSASVWLRRCPAAATYLPAVAFAAGCAVAVSYAAFQVLTQGAQIAPWYRTLWLACALTLPASMLSGVLFTFLGEALQREIVVETRTAGWLTLANTAGGMCGPLLAAFVMLPALGMERSFFALAASYLGIGGLALWGVRSWRAPWRSPAVAVGGIALALTLAWFPFGLMGNVYFARVARPYAADGSRIVATREGPSETIFLMQQKWMDEPVYTRLVTNGFSMSGTAVPAMRYMRYFVYWPMVLHRGPVKHALVVCYGVGVTAGAALDLPSVESIDVAEISPDVVAVSDLIVPSNHPLHDPRVRLHLEDGRQLLQTTSMRFDLITGEPPPPRTPGAVNIYTREYFQLTRDRLAEGGMTTYWLPVGRPDPGTDVTTIIRAFCDVFDDCSLWNATPFDLMLAGTRGATGPVSEAEFFKPWRIPDLRSRLSEVGLELPQQVGATFLGDSAYLRQLTAGTPPLDDDHPQRLQPVPGRPSLSDPGYGVDAAVTRMYESVLDPARARQAFATSPFIRQLWPEHLIAETLPFFEHQRILNNVFWEGGHPLRQVENLHWLLTETPLRTLPLWILGSDEVKERIAWHVNDGTGAAEYARGLAALVARDYLGAASTFADSDRRGLTGETIRPLRVYALCLAGKLDTARQLAQGTQPRGAEERQFWEWLGRRFGVGPFSGG
jgi:spermidine synthase